MSFLRGADFIYTLRFLRLLTMPYEKTDAFKQGIIDRDGDKLKSPETSDEKKAYGTFHRLVFNIRRLMAKIPGGRSTIARYMCHDSRYRGSAHRSVEHRTVCN